MTDLLAIDLSQRMPPDLINAFAAAFNDAILRRRELVNELGKVEFRLETTDPRLLTRPEVIARYALLQKFLTRNNGVSRNMRGTLDEATKQLERAAKTEHSWLVAQANLRGFKCWNVAQPAPILAEVQQGALAQ